MKRYTESEIAAFSVKELFAERRKCASERNLFGLYDLAKYLFEHGSIATNEYHMPEFAFLSGRTGNVEEFLATFQKYRWTLFGMPSKYITITQNMLTLGMKYPNLNYQELDYIEQLASSPDTFEIMEDILCDRDLLPRDINVLTKASLNVKNDSFSDSFLDKVANCFEINEELLNSSGLLYVYDRTHNTIVKKRYEDVGLGEFCINCSLHTNEYFPRIEKKFGKDFADFCVNATCGSHDPKSFRTLKFYVLGFSSIVGSAEDYYHDSSKVQLVKREAALMWLEEVNAIEYK